MQRESQPRLRLDQQRFYTGSTVLINEQEDQEIVAELRPIFESSTNDTLGPDEFVSVSEINITITEAPIQRRFLLDHRML